MKQSFGGKHLIKKRKSQRPLDLKKSTHLILRLKEQLPSLFDPRDQNLKKGFLELAHKYQIRVYDLVFNHTHVHCSLKIPDRKAYQRFIRELTSKLVSYFSRKIKVRLRQIFMNRPFTRIVAWGRAFAQLRFYMQKNEKESGVQQLRQKAEQRRVRPKQFEAETNPQFQLKFDIS